MKYTSKAALLSNIIDYAGTFPPAALSLSGAIEEAAKRDLLFKYPWLYSKFCLGLEDLKTIHARTLFEKSNDGRDWQFTALASKPGSDGPPKTSEELGRAIEWDLREIRRINERGIDAPKRYWISAYEVRLPDWSVSGAAASTLPATLSKILDRTERAHLPGLALYFEIPLLASWESVFKTAFSALADARENSPSEKRPLGVKFRMAGVQNPTLEETAGFLAQTVLHGFRFKATQGLHAALTHDGVLGFVNLFAALNLAQALGTESFGANEIASCLKDETVSNFKFEPEKFSWKTRSLDLDTIESARRQHAGCFGSCSLAEPDESLTKLFPS